MITETRPGQFTIRHYTAQCHVTVAEYGDPKLYVGSVYCPHADRQRGYGIGLMNQVRALVIRLGLTAELEVWPYDREGKRPTMTKAQTIKFYEKFGFRLKYPDHPEYGKMVFDPCSSV